MTVSLHTLPNGVYTVTWKAVSAVDGHQTVGTFPFAVGNVNATAVQVIQQSCTSSLLFSGFVSKFLLLALLAILVGQRLFIALVWDPALKSNQNDVSQPAVWTMLYRVGLIGILLSVGLGILSQAGQTTGTELSYPWDSATGHVLVETRLGIIWLLRLMFGILAIWLAGRKVSPLRDWTAFGVNLALLTTVTFTSHAATEAQPLLPILGDLIHLLGMTFWLGGLVYLSTGIRQLQQLEGELRTKLTSLLAARFSINAIIFVALIGLTGFYSAYLLRVGSWSALLTRLCGHVLLVKQAFVAGLLTIAATNLLIISPRLSRERIQGTANSNGAALYATNCVPCHGVSGKGDGPIGVTMNPRPADLTQHAIPGVHTDAQLYEWITNGFPGTRMPAFKSGLSDTDRWNLVNFIRTFAPK